MIRRRRPAASFFGPANYTREITRLRVAAALPPAAVHRQAVWIGIVFVGLALVVTVLMLLFGDRDGQA